MDTLNEQRSAVSANLQTLNISIEKLQSSLANYSNALSRITDTDYATETTQLVQSQIKSESSMAILAKGNEHKFSIGQLLEGVQIPMKNT